MGRKPQLGMTAMNIATYYAFLPQDNPDISPAFYRDTTLERLQASSFDHSSWLTAAHYARSEDL
jgi:hypothetical protein